MRKLMLFVGGGAVGFALAVFVLRFLLASGGDTTIRLATSAPPIPGVEAAALPAAAAAASVDAAQQPNAAGTNGAPAASADAPPAATAPVASADAAPVAAKPASAPADGPFHFKADPAQSTTKILVTQTGLLGDALLVANGSNVTGDIFLTQDGRLAGSPSAFQVDLRTLRSNDSELSSFLKNQLEAGAYPYGQFSIASISGIPATYTNGTEFTFTMTGPLTMHGRTRNITWTARARQVGDFLTFAADGDFLMTDYGWTPPNYGVAWAKNSVHIQVTVISRKDASVGGEQVRVAGPSATSTTGNVDPAPVAPSLSSSAPVLSTQTASGPASTSPAPGGLEGLSSLLGSGPAPAGAPSQANPLDGLSSLLGGGGNGASSQSNPLAGLTGLLGAGGNGAASQSNPLAGLTGLLGGGNGGQSFNLDDILKMLGGLGGGGGGGSLFPTR